MSSSEWPTHVLSEILQTPLRNGVNKPRKVRGDGYKMVNMGELFANSIIRDIDMERVPMSDRELANSLLEDGDLLFARQSLTVDGAGKCSLFLGGSEPTTFEGHLIRARLNPDKVLPRYLFYYFQSHFGMSQIKSIVTVTAAAGIRSSDLGELEIPLPPLHIQRRIASILSALDDKIELNRQTNATLEAMAQAIFKEWFVDFNFPGATGEMQESELGEIPVGWRVGSILEIADLLSGGTPSTQIAEYWGNEHDWVSAKDVSSSARTFILETERKITQLGLEKSNTRMLPELTTIITARGSVGNFSIIPRPMTMNQTNYGLKSKIDHADYFIFFALGNLVAQLQKAAYGTIFDTVTTRTFEQSRLVLPGEHMIQKFNALVEPIMIRILVNLEQSNTIAMTRDTLLPRLMRGEIDV